MPVLQYFGFVGAALLALLFIADAQLPRPVARDEPVVQYKIRVASSRSGPEAVTFAGRTVD